MSTSKEHIAFVLYKRLGETYIPRSEADAVGIVLVDNSLFGGRTA